MSSRLQWQASVRINAPRERVWSIVDDISLIPEYHPEVTKVELLTGQRIRAVGVRYQCVISEGTRKGSCVEEVTDYIPGQRMATAFPEDTWGISKMFKEFVVATELSPMSERQTVLVLKAYYEPANWKIRAVNAVFLRYAMARRAQRTIEGIKRLAEVGTP